MQFRYKALAQMREPDELDRLLRYASPGSWVATAVVGVVLAAGLVWSVTGSIPRTIVGEGMLTHPLGLSPVQSDREGYVVSVPGRLGDTVKAGDDLVRLRTDGGGSSSVIAPFPGRVVEILATDGQLLAVGGPVAVVERTDAADDRLLAAVLVPAVDAVSLRRGTPVDLEVSAAPRAAFGVLRGRVTSVDTLPVRGAELRALFGDSPLTERAQSAGGDVRVVVDLTRDAGTASGLAWSSRDGPPFPLLSQVEVRAVFRVTQVRPIDLLLNR